MADFGMQRAALALGRASSHGSSFLAEIPAARPRSLGAPQGARAYICVYNQFFRFKLWSDKNMIRFLQTPGPIKKIVLGGLLTVICAAMAITLIPGGIGDSIGLGGPGQGVVAKVAGEPVTTLEVQREARQMLRQQFPRGGEQTAMLLPYFAERAAQNLISRKALVAEAERLGLRVTNEELRDELQHGRYAATFFPGGKFVGQQQYENILQNADLSVPMFEQGAKDDILLGKLRNLIAGSALVTDSDVRREFEKQNTKVKFDYAVLRKDDLAKQIKPTEAELKAFYERNKATLQQLDSGEAQSPVCGPRHGQDRSRSECVSRRSAGLLRPASRRVPRARASQCKPYSDQDSAAGSGWES